MIDETSGLPYYYQTKTGETVWERPQAFVIPLTTLQNTALGRRLSIRQSTYLAANSSPSTPSTTPERLPYRRSHSYTNDKDLSRQSQSPRRRSQSSTRRSPPGTPTQLSSPGSLKKQQAVRRTSSNESHLPSPNASGGPLAYPRGHSLAPIPGSPYATDVSPPPSPSSRRSKPSTPVRERAPDGEKDSPPRMMTAAAADSLGGSRSKSSSYLSYHAPQPQSLSAALEMIALSNSNSQSSNYSEIQPLHAYSDSGHIEPSSSSSSHTDRPHVRISTDPGVNGSLRPGHIRGHDSPPATPLRMKGKSREKGSVPPSPRRPVPSIPQSSAKGTKTVSGAVQLRGKDISGPVVNREAAMNLSPMPDPTTGQPIPVECNPKLTRPSTSSLNTGKYPILPFDLASDIQQFSESQFARQYFSTHRTGFIFRRKVPVEQMMSWQKTPLSSPLLLLNRALHKNAIKIFKVIQHIMGDRERDRPLGVRVASDNLASLVKPINGSTTSLVVGPSSALLEEERWLLGEGLLHGELRDEIYCQVMKQLNGNSNTESVFKGWQLLCVLLVTFPPSKNFETSLRSYMQQATTQQEGRVDVMAKYCIRRLAHISSKGPRGKPPSVAEIETASDAAFHPSIFGESLDAIFRLQERNYPHMQVPIILPFLADGILALGGTKSEGIFRIPGDGDAVSELKLRIEKGYYSLEDVDDPHVLASLLKLWLRELCDPLIPDELYNDCITHSKEPDTCVQIVHRLPTINRRVILFVVSFLQLFLEEKVHTVTKMTAPNLALVMAPNLLRCNSDSMAVVFTNAQYEQSFVYNLLLHLKCHEVDPEYAPTHGQGAIPAASPIPRTSKSRRRTNR
ncbi:hypothetical protein BKA93DRAFT_721925 [Sparassis latifolia]